jgi:hypothetical protein
MKKFLLLLLLTSFVSRSFSQTDFEFTHFNQASVPALGGNNFKTAAVGRGGHIWVGSQYHGLVKYNPTTNTWEASTALTDVFISDIKADRFGNVWVANAGRSGTQGGGSNIAGGISQFTSEILNTSNFWSITTPGFLTSRNVRSIWIDANRTTASKPVVWGAQGTYISSNVTVAGGISVGKNNSTPVFTKVYEGLQVTPYVGVSSAGTPSCLAIAGNHDEVWVFAQANFSKNQILRYRADSNAHVFLGSYDNTTTAALPSGFRANALYFDDLNRGWIGMNSGGVVIKTAGNWFTMNDPAIFPIGAVVNPNAITSDQNGFVYIGTNLGLVIYRGGALDSASSYIRVTTTDGLPTNNINGIAIDTFAKRIVLAHSAGISFMKFKKKVNATLEWDYSFPKLDIKPKGVATDGVSRLYIKVRRNDSVVLAIKKVALTVKNLATTAASMIGKLKVANVLSEYSNEANTGTSTEVSRTDSTPAGDFYFWYVAPDDFSKDSISKEAKMTEREDSIKVKVTYSDDSEDSSYISVKLQRPPVMVGGMFSGIGKMVSSILKNVGGIPLLQSDLFLKKIGLIMNPLSDMSENIKRLLDGDLLQNEDKEHSLQGLLEGVRKMGYAANRVDFVGHGIAGNVARAAAAVKKAKFYADGGQTYNNYGKGFFNKFIGIAVPNNGSPILDMIKEIAPRIQGLALANISKILQLFPDTLKPYPVLTAVDTLLKPSTPLLEKASLAAQKLASTAVKNHLIVSNVELDPAAPKPYKGGGFLGGISHQIAGIARDVIPLLKVNLTSMMDSTNSQLFKSLNMLNLFANAKGLTEFSKNSDLFSHIMSQAAGQVLTLPNITKITSDNVDDVVHDGILSFGKIGRLVENLLNQAIGSPAFSDQIPADNTPVPAALQISQKPLAVSYDTNKVVTDDRQLITGQNLRTTVDPTIVLKYRVKDTVGLQYVYINFQDSMYTTISKQKNQQVTLKIRKAMAYTGIQQIEAVGVYETADSIIYHADTINAYVTPPAIQDFRVKTEEVALYDDLLFQPTYEVKANNVWQDLPSNDTAIKIAIEKPAILKYDSAAIAFSAISDGYTRSYFTYKSFKDTVAFECQANSLSAVNRSIASGNFKDAATWSKGRAPLPGDSIIISASHNIVLDTTAQIRSLRIDNLGTLTLNNATKQLQLGDAEDGDFVLDNYGTLNISNGSLVVKGRVKLNQGSTFNMTGGTLVVDGNTGYTITSLQNGLFLFEAAPLMNSFSFTGGTLQIVDPPLGVASQAISCPYNFGVNSTLVLGNGISLTASNNPNGFGGSLFPPEIGKLVLDAGTAGSNRQLTITKPLNVKGSFVVKAGSNVSLQAPVTVTQ